MGLSLSGRCILGIISNLTAEPFTHKIHTQVVLMLELTDKVAI